MARLWTAGAETNFVSASGATLGVTEGTTGGAGDGTIAVATTHVRSGIQAFKFDSATTGDKQLKVGDPAATALATAHTYYLRSYVYVEALPTADTDIMFIGLLRARLKTTGALAAWNQNLSAQIGSDSVNLLVTGVWYRIEMSMLFNSAADDTVELRLDGVTVASATQAVSTAVNTNSFSVGWIGDPGTSIIMWADDIAVNDDTGASQNSWPGDGSVVLLVPTADSAVGTGWTLGTGTAIASNSGAAAVDNEPPLGVADLAVGSDPKQIRNATANASVSYDATMTTYSAAGIPPNSAINVVDPLVATAAPVTTSSKQGTVGVVSNPAITNVALGAVGTAGAFWSGTTAGTYPVGWKISHGTPTYAPAVTLATAPVMRVTQVTSSTRIAMVCFMGMYVDFTPPSLARSKFVRQARNRATSF